MDRIIRDKRFVIGIAALLLFVGGLVTGLVIKNRHKEEQVVSKEEKEKKEKEEKSKRAKEIIEKQKELEEKAPKLPDLTGLTLNEATAKLNKENISSNYAIRRVDSDLMKDVVVSTDPAAGAPVIGTISIIFYLSNGKNGVVIEDYEGKDYKEIKEYLELRGIDVKLEIRKANYERDDVPEDMIVGQDVYEGKELKAGNTITLYLAEGTVKYPNFTTGEYVLEDVQKFCDTYGITCDVYYDEPDGTQIVGEYPKKGSVFFQDKTDIVKNGDVLRIGIAEY